MTELVKVVSDRVPSSCRASNCDKEGCRVSMKDAPPQRVLVDLDCNDLELAPTSKRCDYVFVGDDGVESWVAPIELKGGRFKALQVAKQLQGGAEAADRWLPPDSSFRFVPTLCSWQGHSPRRTPRAGAHQSHAARSDQTTADDPLQ